MKKRLLISSVLMSAVLACALGTGTYAWYQASSTGDVNTTNTSGKISASADTYTVGGDVTIVASFGGTDYHPAVNETPGYFTHVHLTNDWGYTYAYTAGGKVVQTVSPTYGYANFSITLGELDPAKLAQVVGGKSYTITLSGDQYARIHAEAPTKAQTDGVEDGETFIDEDMIYTLSFTANGSFALTDSGDNPVAHNNGVWSIPFYYSVKNSSENAELADAHANDVISVTIAEVE